MKGKRLIHTDRDVTGSGTRYDLETLRRFGLIAELTKQVDECPGCERKGDFKAITHTEYTATVWCPECGTIMKANKIEHGIDVFLPNAVYRHLKAEGKV